MDVLWVYPGRMGQAVATLGRPGHVSASGVVWLPPGPASRAAEGEDVCLWGLGCAHSCSDDGPNLVSGTLVKLHLTFCVSLGCPDWALHAGGGGGGSFLGLVSESRRALPFTASA